MLFSNTFYYHTRYNKLNPFPNKPNKNDSNIAVIFKNYWCELKAKSKIRLNLIFDTYEIKMSFASPKKLKNPIISVTVVNNTLLPTAGST